MAFSPPLLVFFLLVSSLSLSSSEPVNPEVEALINVRKGLNDPHGILSSWDIYSVDPCSWAMVTCSPDNHVTALGAPSQSLSGTLSGWIGNLANLEQVLMQNNNISGVIPGSLGRLSKLQTLDLSNNKFTGSVPDSLGQLTSLQYLRLNNNSLFGAFPVSLTKIPILAFLDLSYNNLSGPIPRFPARTFNIVGNPLICRSESVEDCPGTISTVPLPISIDSSNGKTKRRQKLGIAIGVSLGSTFLFTFVLLIFIWCRKRQSNHMVLDITNDKQEGMIRLGNLRQFTLRELQVATDNFSVKNILGKGGFGNVYKGRLTDGTVVAVKRLKDLGGSATSGEAQFRTEVEMISLAVHRNLLRLLGYCATSNEKLLVYPYMSNGSVASRLKAKPALDWNTRKQIALGAARGLVYLHEQCDPKIIHRDVKAANVLLDDYCEAIVGDFGLAKLLDHSDTHVTTAVRGTVGHIAPEYLSTGQSSDKTDVFGFGILLLELIIGMRVLDFGKSANRKGAMLDAVRKIHQEKKLDLLVDKDLGSNYDRIEVGEMLQVALLCTQYQPTHRPKMSVVVRMLEGDGLAKKWEASQKFNTVNVLQSTKSQASIGANDSGTASLISMVDMGSTDDPGGHDVEAMELSGPR